MKKVFVLLAAAAFMLAGCCPQGVPSDGIVSVSDGHFVKNGEPYYFVGTNFWYGPILASDGQGGDYERLTRELDFLAEAGLHNLRVLVGSDGLRGVPAKVEPTLQTSPRVYNDTLLVGLDRFLVELGKRDMEAVLYLNNSWEWTGGYGQYLEWAGHGKAAILAVDGWEKYFGYVRQYFKSPEAMALFDGYVEDIVTRVNSITGKPYSEDPAIFAWQIGNEPRMFGLDNAESFCSWIRHAAQLIKSFDPNHMVSIGSEGSWGCENSMEVYRRICSYPEVDYINAHIWPYNWSWIKADDMAAGIDVAISNTNQYIDEHLEVARSLSKPLTVEEFGFPRDGFSFAPGSPTTLRDRYYSNAFERIVSSRAAGDCLAGVNFWGWGGFAEPSSEHIYWAVGDDYTGDPAQEEQGLNSVFARDSSTLSIITSATSRLK